MKKRTEIFLIMAFILIFIIIGIGVYVTLTYLNTSSLNTIENLNNDILTVLFVGVDNLKINEGRTDTIFIVMYSFKTGKLFLYSIPRDLRIKVNYNNKFVYDKINHIYHKSNIFTLKSSIERLLNIKIPYYVILNYELVSSIVDLIGGVKVYIEKPMKYTDKAGNLYINLEPGFHILDGEKVLEYLRYRNDEEGDIGRIKRQVNFVNLLFQKKEKFLTFENMQYIIKLFYKKLDTNFTYADILTLYHEFINFKTSNFYYDLLLVKPIRLHNIDYLIPLQGGDYCRLRLSQIFEFLNTKDLKWKHKITVEIKNGTGKPGLAKLLRNKLIYYNIDVLYYGNTDKRFKETVVFDRVGNLEFAKTVAKIIKTKNVYTRINKTLGVDVTIIIGEDFNIDYVE